MSEELNGKKTTMSSASSRNELNIMKVTRSSSPSIPRS
jgi:hypothetical protein